MDFFPMRNKWLLLVLLLLSSTIWSKTLEYHSPHTFQPYQFKMSVIDANATGSYGLIGYDINQDGFTDLVSFAYSGTSAGNPEGEIYWYEFLGTDPKNDEPQWKKHFITKKKHVVHGTFLDINEKGSGDLVFLSNFEVPIQNESNEGDIWWAKRPSDLNANEWKTYWIGRLPGVHRLVSLNLEGMPAIAAVPIFSKGKPPMYGATSIALFIPGKDPKLPWQKKIFSNLKLHAIHDAIPWTINNANDNLLLASAEGVTKVSFNKNANNEWEVNNISLHSAPTTQTTKNRDIGTQVLGFNNPPIKAQGVTALSNFSQENTFIAAIDYDQRSGFLSDQPWHGDTVSVYIPNDGEELSQSKKLDRKILEKRSAGGHAVQLIHLKNNDCPDVLAGFRAYPTGLIVYHCKKNYSEGKVNYFFEKQIISERSANAIVIGQWDKSGVPGFATVGFGSEGDPYILLWRYQK